MDYSIKIDEFEGPLDLLLHLIKKSNIDIYDISIEKITNQYLEYINKMEELNITVASSYLVMAAELMEIKSKSLLPKTLKEEDENEEEVSREKLIEKLVEYKKYKEVTPKFHELEIKRSDIFVKAPEIQSNYVEKLKNNEGITIDDLLSAFKSFLNRKEQEKPLTTKVTNKEYSLRARKSSIKQILLDKKKIEFTELFDIMSKSYIVVTFLSVLEMVKEDTINLKQDKNFDKILLELKVK